MVDGSWLQMRFHMGYPGTAYSLVLCVAQHLSAEAEIRV